MQKIFAVALAPLPSFLKKWVWRRLGASIHPTAHIGFGSVLMVRHLSLAENARIGSFVFLRVHTADLKQNAVLKPFSIYSCYELRLGEYAQISMLCVILSVLKKSAVLTLGAHSRIFPLCWIEPGAGVTIGSHVGVGGQGLIFTHGVWPDYLEGGPVAFGPIAIGDGVWLPWRVFILPGVTIGPNAIIGAGAVVNRSVAANALAGGIPAKLVKENAIAPIDLDEKQKRARQIIADFVAHAAAASQQAELLADGVSARIGMHKISLDSQTAFARGDVYFALSGKPDHESYLRRDTSVIVHADKVLYLAAHQHLALEFLAFLRGYGVRLSVKTLRSGRL